MEVGNWKLEEASLSFKKKTADSYVSTAKQLEVYKIAYRASLAIHKHSLSFPKIEQYGGIADQLRRATKSICANLAEGFSKQTQSIAEFRRFISMALGSAGEVGVWLDYCFDLAYIDAPTHAAWSEAYHSVSRMLQSLRNKAKNNSNF